MAFYCRQLWGYHLLNGTGWKCPLKIARDPIRANGGSKPVRPKTYSWKGPNWCYATQWQMPWTGFLIGTLVRICSGWNHLWKGYGVVGKRCRLRAGSPYLFVASGSIIWCQTAIESEKVFFSNRWPQSLSKKKAAIVWMICLALNHIMASALTLRHTFI